jgi:hypothetical protein
MWEVGLPPSLVEFSSLHHSQKLRKPLGGNTYEQWELTGKWLLGKL